MLLDLADNRGDDAAETLIEVGDPLCRFRPRSIRARNRFHHWPELQISRSATPDTGKVLYELINISYQRGLRLPAELTLLAKTLFNLDAVARSIDPTFSPIPTIRDFGAQIAADRAKRDLNPRRLFQLATEAGELVDGAPAPHRSHHSATRLE